MPGDTLISVIIATTCEQRRRAEILRAVESVCSQSVPHELLMVVNGTRYDPQLYAELQGDPRLKTFYLQEGSFPAALKYGRRQANGAFYSFLDDDDLYLDGALETRLKAIETAPAADFVATNGWVQTGNTERLMVSDAAAVERDPLGANLRGNWLGSSAALFRSASVPPEFFDGSTKHYEWTLLTHRLLVAGKRVRFVDSPTFYKYDTPVSLSKDRSIDPLVTAVRMLREMLAEVEPRHRPLVEEKLNRALHELSQFHADRREFQQAWTYHLASLGRGRSWRYLSYTGRLVTSYWASHSAAASPRFGTESQTSATTVWRESGQKD